MRMPITTGTSTACAYCAISIAPRTATTVSAALRTSTGIRTMTGSGGVWRAAASASVELDGKTGASSSSVRLSATLLNRPPSAAALIRPNAVELCTLRTVRVADFDFVLPDELVAQAAAPRGTSRLLVLDRERGSRRHA